MSLPHRFWRVVKIPAALLTLSFVEFAVAMFVFLLPGSWDVESSAVSALFFSVSVPWSYAVVAFVTIVNITLFRYATVGLEGGSDV